MSNNNKFTKSLSSKDVKRQWHLVDATDLVAGRIATQIAMILRGKHRADYTPHIDCGDNVIVINAEKICMKGKKLTNKVYFRHTGHPGGIKETTPAKIITGKNPEQVVEKAVQRMMSREKPLGRTQFGKLFVYAGPSHPHEAQNPKKLDLGARNNKNKKLRTSK